MPDPKGKGGIPETDVDALLEQLVLELADLFPLTDKEDDIKDPQ